MAVAAFVWVLLYPYIPAYPYRPVLILRVVSVGYTYQSGVIDTKLLVIEVSGRVLGPKKFMGTRKPFQGYRHEITTPQWLF